MTAWLEALTRHTSVCVCSVVWLQRTVSDQSYRINKSDNVRMKARERPRSLASVSPLINLRVIHGCPTSSNVPRESLTVTSGRAFTDSAHLSLTKFFPQQPLCSSFLWRHIFLSWDVFLWLRHAFQLVLLPHLRIPVKHRLRGLRPSPGVEHLPVWWLILTVDEI